jgi:glycosyltransferase involved in cell wall biosynthesis
MLTELITTSLMPEEVEYPPIEPITEGVHRPLWSVMIPTYNRTKYLEKALKSVLDQALAPELMQIEIVDNCSTESDIEAFVRKIAQDRVSFYRQPQHVNLNTNMTTCIKRARGHLVHILHDDDVVLPGFYTHLQEAFEKEPNIGAAFCRYAHVNEEERHLYLPTLERSTPGILENSLERIAVQVLIQPPAIVVRRSVYEKLGAFHSKLRFTGDWEMCQRIAAHYPLWYEPQILAYYRIHSSSATSDILKSGENVADRIKTIEICHSYLPNAIADKLSIKARENAAINILGIARRVLAKGDVVTTMVQIREALKCSTSLKVIGVLPLVPILAGVDSVKKVMSNRMLSFGSKK